MLRRVGIQDFLQKYTSWATKNPQRATILKIEAVVMLISLIGGILVVTGGALAFNKYVGFAKADSWIQHKLQVILRNFPHFLQDFNQLMNKEYALVHGLKYLALPCVVGGIVVGGVAGSVLGFRCLGLSLAVFIYRSKKEP